MAFSTDIVVRFGDEDHAGIVYYPRIFNFFHVAFEDFFNHQGLSYARVIDGDRVGFPTVHVEADFKKPLRFGDVVEVQVWVERIGSSSAVFRYRARTKEGHQTEVNGDSATAAITVVCVSMETWKAVPLPQHIRQLFERNSTPPAP